MTEVVVKDYENDIRNIIEKSVDKVIGSITAGRLSFEESFEGSSK